MSQYKICPTCGAHLDYGETCECQRKRAVCPLFLTRCDHSGRHYILCLRKDGAVSAALCHETVEERDASYLEKCCDNPLTCPLRVASSVVKWAKDEAGQRKKVLDDLMRGTLWAGGTDDA